ncbi:MAG: DUF4351 domain-containing protein [Gemmataceae bacterium]
MPGPLDDTLKHLTELSPQDWVVQGGWPMAPATAIDADIATITGAADKVIRVDGSPDWLLAVDFHSGHDAGQLLPRMLLYNAALGKRHGLRVRSLAVVLHARADSPQLSGVYERGFPGEPADIMLRYRVLRVWEVPAARWLSGGLGVLPLAPLGAVQEAELPALIAQMKERLDREVPRRQAVELWSATYILMGTRYEEPLIETLLQGVITMEESVTYQAILRKGEAKGQAKEARRMLLLQGRSRFGEPTPEVVAAVDALADVEKLEQLGVKLLQVSSWQELLGWNG